MAGAKGRPPRHGDIRVGGGMKIEHAKRHLAELTAGAAEVRDYGGHSVTGQGSQGGMSPGGASGADYELYCSITSRPSKNTDERRGPIQRTDGGAARTRSMSEIGILRQLTCGKMIKAREL